MQLMRTTSHSETAAVAARRIVLNGHVQGLGVRPCASRLAESLQLAGSVRNAPEGVVIVIEGMASNIAAFEQQLPDALPSDAVVESMLGESVDPSGDQKFVVVTDAAEGGLSAPIPADRAVCQTCLDEVRAPSNRRYRYPFTSCTLCGPRYSIIRQMPYERDDTTMVEFPLCPSCQREYDSPVDRRFHAQTNACPDCGPQVWGVRPDSDLKWHGEECLQEAVKTIRQGGIVALKGLGGYQLLADATNAEAVRCLRNRKKREAKPLAVLVRSLSEAEKIANINALEKETLASTANPIVLLQARKASPLCNEIHPDLAWVGIVLPTTPLHALLAYECSCPLVCTSGNSDGDPLVYTVAAAQEQLADLCDFWLHHDRRIEHPIDDSVVRVIGNHAVTIRLARGLAPLKLNLPPIQPAMAMGGHLKCSVAWSNGYQSVLGPHIGDMDTQTTRQRLIDEISSCKQVYRFEPKKYLCDEHPDYFTTRWANESHLPCRSLQHHYAHVTAGMLENGWLDREVVGVSWDGTGYGDDGTVWGGEFLVCDANKYRRVARLRPFALSGGEQSIHKPWRLAVSTVLDALGEECAESLRFVDVSAAEIATIAQLCKSEKFSIETTSAGRLFDAATSLILGITEINYEGQAPMMLESIADVSAAGQYPTQLVHSEIDELDWRPMFEKLITDRQNNIAPTTMAMRFHRGLAHGIVEVCRRWSHLPVVLAGGVFQNKLLTELVIEMMAEFDQPLGLPNIIPPGDGGLAAGQLATEFSQSKI